MKLQRVTGFVYILKSGDHYKIGNAIDPVRRLKSLQAAWPEPMEIVHKIESDRYKYIERDLHRRFAGKRVRGEWFALSDEDLAYIRGLNAGGCNPDAATKDKRFWDRVVLATMAEMKYRRMGKFRDIPASEYVPKVEYF